MEGSKEAETSDAMQQKLERKRKMIVSYAKAVAGRAMTSCVVGALNAMETLGELRFEDEEEKIDGGEGSRNNHNVEHNLLRRGVWTCLLALETAFQLNNRPKLLMTSSMSVSSLESTASYSGGVDFDMMSSVLGSPASGGNGPANSTTWMHTHLMMGGSTVAMWNGLMQRIMMDYKLGFHLQNDTPHENAYEENQLLSQLCHEVADHAFSDEDDAKFISLVLQKSAANSADEEPPTKKTKRTSKTKNAIRHEMSEEELSELSALLAQRRENHILFECHVSVRRWSTLAFGWLCSGQPRFLDACMNMLTRKEVWKKVLEIAPIENSTTAALDTSKPSSSKKKKKECKTQLSSDAAVLSHSERSTCVRGDLALVTFISCMIDLISSGGISPSNSGWMDEYVKAITNMSDTATPFTESNATFTKQVGKEDDPPIRRSARTRSKVVTAKTGDKTAAAAAAAGESPRTSPKGGKKLGVSWVRPNVTDEVAFLTNLLIEAHTSCLNDAFRDHLLESEALTTLESVAIGKRMLLVNDDDSYRDSVSYRRHDLKELVNSIMFYPFMHRTLETLGRMAASSSFAQFSGGKSRIVAIGGAIGECILSLDVTFLPLVGLTTHTLFLKLSWS
jgi:hypothetical protein